MYAGIWEIDLHGKNEYQARVTLDAALRREYGRHPQVLRLEAAGPGVTELVLREF